MAKMRLQKFLARAGVASRRKCDEVIIPSGRVTVNGEAVTSTGVSVDPDVDDVRLDGKEVSLPEGNFTLMLNKPKGYETTMSSDHYDKLVADLVPLSAHPSLVPIGRLDKDTTGLLLFTTDGDLCNGLLHPARNVDKTYIATVDGNVGEDERRRLERGIEMDGRMTAPAVCKIVGYDPKRRKTVAEITIHEGRNRQVRKMFSAIGHEVEELHRERFGPLTLGELAPGKWRELDDAEVASLISASAKRQ